MRVATTAAREAYAREDWGAVHDALGAEPDGLDTSDLEMLAAASWWLGDSAKSMAVSEQVYQRLIAAGDALRAADRAIRLTLEWAIRGDIPIADAWMARARRLLRDLPRSPVHGYLAYAEAMLDLDMTSDPGPSARRAEEVEGFATEFDDPALDCFARALRGMSAIRRGETVDGFAELDEAMLPVLAGQVDSLWSGDIYCTVIHLCDDLADLTRMRSWTAALAGWSTPRSKTFMYAGVTRIHELQLIAAEGDWDTVERELGDRSANLVGSHGWLAGEGYYALGEVRRLRGDADGARAAFDSARDLGHSAQPGSALLHVAGGDSERALAELRVTLADGSRLERARMLLPAVELALELRDTTYAAGLVDELEATAAWYGTPGLRARADQARAAVLMDRGRPDAALELLTDAARVYRDQRHRHASATVHERLAAAHRANGSDDHAAAERATAIAIYRQLGAAPDLARLDDRTRPGGLTEREVEVLELVSRGASNQEVAQALTISHKTVGRHLSNIFTKLDVSSRTSAAAWARENGL